MNKLLVVITLLLVGCEEDLTRRYYIEHTLTESAYSYEYDEKGLMSVGTINLYTDGVMTIGRDVCPKFEAKVQDRGVLIRCAGGKWPVGRVENE